jgi:hypothetical protein
MIHASRLPLSPIDTGRKRYDLFRLPDLPRLSSFQDLPTIVVYEIWCWVFFLSFLFHFSSFVSNTRWRPMWNWYAGASSLGGYSAGRDSDRLRGRERERKKQVWIFVGHCDDIPLVFFMGSCLLHSFVFVFFLFLLSLYLAMSHCSLEYSSTFSDY